MEGSRWKQMDGKDGGKRLKERKLFKCGKNSVVGAESLCGSSPVKKSDRGSSLGQAEMEADWGYGLGQLRQRGQGCQGDGVVFVLEGGLLQGLHEVGELLISFQD